MNSDKSNKVVWKRSGKGSDGESSDISALDISARAGSHNAARQNNTTEVNQSEINSLKSEIDKMLGDTDDSPNGGFNANIPARIEKKSQGEGDENPSSEMTSSLDDVAKENHEALIASLKDDIQADLSAVEDHEKDSQNLGVGQTYYSDLASAMGKNEPATMSELIRKSRFEERESKILSPKSRKNIIFIALSLLLLILSIGILSSVFKKKEVVEFITEQKVSSLVRSNLDTGINTTRLEQTRIKQAIRDVIEMKIPEDSINQIYYLEEDGLGNMRRIGIKDIFRKTNNQIPDSLYDNIENEFTHGVYRTDKNYPFIIMKALSYDRALEGLKEWEPTMIDDLATYLDLPPEATDRSLLKPGFEDDLIRNKNVRVARFLPREVDKRGILDFFLGDNSKEETTTDVDPTRETVEAINEESTSIEYETLSFIDRARLLAESFVGYNNAYAQTPGSNSNTAVSICKESVQERWNQEIQDFHAGDSSYNSIAEIEAKRTAALASCENSYNSWGFNSLTGGPNETISISKTPICFNQYSGERIPKDDIDGQKYGFCFTPYVCYKYTCFIDNVDVGPDAWGQPGAKCGEDRNLGPVPHKDDDGYNAEFHGTKQSCYQFLGLMSVQNISDAILCFDMQGQYLPGVTTEGDGVVCTSSLQNQDLICMDKDNRIIPPTLPGPDVICFQPFQNLMTSVGVMSTDSCKDMTYVEIRQQAMSLAHEIRSILYYAEMLGLGDQDHIDLDEVADFLENIAHGNIELEIEGMQQATSMMRRVEMVLDRIDGIDFSIFGGIGGAVGDVVQILETIIDAMKCIFGDFTLATGNIVIPQGVTVHAGQTLNEVVVPVQQALTSMGIMDSSSVSGTLDLVTQNAISQFQTANRLNVTGIIDPETLLLLQTIMEGQTAVLNDTAMVNDYFDTMDDISLGTYSEDVQALQVILYAEGYGISTINGLFDEETCSALQEFQQDQELEVANPVDCTVSEETIETVNQLIAERGYLGSGFTMSPEGYLTGTGILSGRFGPGVANFAVSGEDDESLKEGDVVLMYMFLDEKTILIVRDEVVIDEVVKRRALSDIFE